MLNGAEIVVKTATKAGIEVCFTNAGTTEIPIVLALDTQPGIKAVLGLFEGVCSGAADGYGRMLDRPAMVLLHLGPGLANAIANLHNARRAKTPLLNIIGEQATWHRSADPPLAMNIESLASTVSAWYKANESPAELSKDVGEAIDSSKFGQISTLIIPNDNQLAEPTASKIASTHFSFDPIREDVIVKAIELLRSHRKTGLFLGGRALRLRGLQAAARIKVATGCDLLSGNMPGYADRGLGLPDVVRLPYFPEPAAELLSQYEALVLVGTGEPVTFFGYQGFSSNSFDKDKPKIRISGDRQNAIEALEHLAEALNAPLFSKISGQKMFPEPGRPGVPQGELTPATICFTVASLQPDNAIIVDEGLTTTTGYYALTAGLPQHTFLAIAGGAIGYGMPCSIGAAVACPQRPIINLQADGSAMYTVQALWTQAREALNVTTLICSNQSYNILKIEMARAGVSSIGPAASSLIDLDRPSINWVRLAEGLGVPAVSVNTAERLAYQLSGALSEPGPHLIEMMVGPAQQR
jgi:acetolactate synthase-1/2/3 large subunit